MWLLNVVEASKDGERQNMSRRVSSKKNKWLESKPVLELLTACENNDAKTALNRLATWLGYFRQELELTSAQQFSQVIGKKEFAEQLAIVRLAVEDPEADWSGEKLYVCVVDILRESHTNLHSSR